MSMASIINGKLYDTKNAELVGDNGVKRLYCTENERYFLASDKEGIEPLGGKDNARRWAERFLNLSTTLDHFDIEDA